MEALLAAIGKTENIAIIVLMLVCAGLGWLHVVWRREEREDRRQLQDLVRANTQAVDQLRTAMSLMVGKPL